MANLTFNNLFGKCITSFNIQNINKYIKVTNAEIINESAPQDSNLKLTYYIPSYSSMIRSIGNIDNSILSLYAEGYGLFCGKDTINNIKGDTGWESHWLKYIYEGGNWQPLYDNVYTYSCYYGLGDLLYNILKAPSILENENSSIWNNKFNYYMMLVKPCCLTNPDDNKLPTPNCTICMYVNIYNNVDEGVIYITRHISMDSSNTSFYTVTQSYNNNTKKYSWGSIETVNSSNYNNFSSPINLSSEIIATIQNEQTEFNKNNNNSAGDSNSNTGDESGNNSGGDSTNESGNNSNNSSSIDTSGITDSLNSLLEMLPDNIGESLDKTCKALEELAESTKITKEKFIIETTKTLYTNFDFNNNSNTPPFNIAATALYRATELANLLEKENYFDS